MISYNVNGTAPQTVAANSEHWTPLFTPTDIILLQETRSVSADPLQGILRNTHDHCVGPNPAGQGTAGHGLAAYWNRQLSSTVRVDTPSEYIMWLTLQTASVALAIANVYVPHNEHAAQQVFEQLHQQASQHLMAGRQVMVAGDLNAHVAAQEDRPLDADGVPLDVVCPRACLPGEALDANGSAVVELCQAQGMVLLTGRSAFCADPQPVEASYVGRGASTRPDHVVVSLQLAGLVTQHRIHSELQSLALSDHLPMLTSLRVANQYTPPAHQPHGERMRRLLWDPAKREQFHAVLEEEGPISDQLQRVRDLTAAGDLNTAVHLMHECLIAAGRAAGMRVVTVGQRGSRQHRHQPWFNQACKEARRAYRQLPNPGQTDLRKLRGVYRREKRRWMAGQLQQFVETCKQQRCYMWRRMQAAVNRTSHVRPDPADLGAFFAAKFAGPGVPQPVDGEGAVPDEAVDQVVNEASVQAALKAVNRRAATGKPGVPVQALAAGPVRSTLVALLRAIYKAGVEPDSMQETLLIAIFKRGDRSLSASYRPIMVSTVLHKVMANVVTQQVLDHREQAAAQEQDPLPRHCGFLPERSTLHNLFVLQNAMHHAQHRKKQLAVLLLDISAAYDSACQQTLLDTLRSQQLPEHVVRMVQGMYAGLECQVVGDHGVPVATVPVQVGVKQGCPASPLLYCYYVQPVSTHLEQMQQADGYTLAVGAPTDGQALPDWAYADDVMILAFSMEGLQVLAGAAAQQFLLRHLHLAPAKCVVLCVNIGAEQQLVLNGVTVPRAPADGQRYLGLMYDRTASAKAMALHRAACMLSAASAVRSQLQAAYTVPTCFTSLRQLFKVSVEPAGLYGCEVWGLLSVLSAGRDPPSLAALYRMDHVLEKRRCTLLRRWFHLPQSTPLLCMLHELGLEPLVHTYIRRAVRWWNSLVALPDSSPYRSALRQNVADGVVHWAGNFSGALYRCLRTVLDSRGLRRHMQDLLSIDADKVEEQLTRRYEEHVQSLEGSLFQRYFREVCSQSQVVGELPCWYSVAVSHGILLRVLRFRLGKHYLRVNTGRHAQPVVPRSRRFCQRCSLTGHQQGAGPVDTEDHCLLDCPCPALQDARQDLLLGIRGAWPTAPLNTTREFFAAVEKLHKLRAHAVKKRCLFFVARCYKEAYMCATDPERYHQATADSEPELSLGDYFDAFNSEEEVNAGDLCDDLDSELEVHWP